MRTLSQAERELHQLHERHARELWAATRRLLAQSHEAGRRDGPRAVTPSLVRETSRDVPSWIREPRRLSARPQPVSAPLTVLGPAVAEPQRNGFHLPWTRARAARSGSGR